MHTPGRHQRQRGCNNARVQAHVVDAKADLPRRPGQRGGVGAFVLVGCAAAAVHWLVVLGLVGRHGWAPLAANGVGWLVAFCVSFTGHHLFSFRGHGAPWAGAAGRFFLVSAGGFAVNEAAYAVLLRWSGAHYGVLLAGVLVGVAGITYWLGRHWAFLRSPPGPA